MTYFEIWLPKIQSNTNPILTDTQNRIGELIHDPIHS
jgi:hypothetical protein